MDFYGDETKPKIISPGGERFAERVESNAHRIKVTDVPSGLCMSCSWSWVYRSKSVQASEWQIFCTQNGPLPRMPNDVDYCNGYSLRGAPSLRDMKDVATLVEKDPPTAVGFSASLSSGDTDVGE